MTKDSLIGKLEKESSSLKAEIAQLETSHSNAIAEHERKFIQLSEEMAAKVAELKKQYINANKEKESMVMKYALNEKEIIIQKKHREKAEETMRAAVKEKDEAVNKAKNAIADKLKLQQLADSRLQDSNVLKKEIDRWKEEVKIQEAKGSLNASKLKSEMEAHQETKEKLDKTIAHLKDTRSEIDQTRQECVDFMKQLKEDEKRQKAAEQEQSVKLMIDAQAATELENIKDKYQKTIEEFEIMTEKTKRQEKLDFMEEHVNTMVEEMKKKNKLLQNLMLKQDSGALVSTDMDTDKRRTSEHTGIMSSLYSSKPNDSGMTLELSLEINQKLQSVLEDTLLKNFTLKENINTLGREIATLTTDSHPA